MRPGYSTHPDRVAAVVERTAREAKQAAVASFNRACAVAARELERCVADGLTDWAKIAPQLRAAAESVRP